MASVFKRKRKVKLDNGKIVVRQSLKYYTRLTDADGIKRTIPLFTDKTASEQRAGQLQKEIELAKAGIVNPYAEQRKKPLADHLKDFKQFLLDKGDTEDHARLTHNRVKAILTGCKIVLISDVRASRIQRYLAERRQSGLGTKTCNYYLTAAKGFFNWMVDDNRIGENPIAHLRSQNSNADIRRVRRSLEPDEIRRLLETTAAGPDRFGMGGYERSLLYRLAAETGLRANEIRSLKVKGFDFDGLTVTVEAGHSKRRREDTQHLRQGTAALLREFFKDKMPNAKAFGGTYKRLTKRTSDILKADLADAGIPYVDDAGRYADFHSLRHTTGSLLAASGVHPKVAQSILRHSDINLTMSRYSHVLRGQESEAIEGLPDFSLPSSQSQRATGTDSRPVGTAETAPKELTPKLTPFLTPTAFPACNRSAAVGNGPGNLQENTNGDNCLKNGELDTESPPLAAVGMGEKEVGRGGFEPPTHGFSVRCSRWDTGYLCRKGTKASHTSQPEASERLVTTLTKSYLCQSGSPRAFRLSRSAILAELPFFGLSSAVSKLIPCLMPLASGRISGVRRVSRVPQSHRHLGQMGRSCDCQVPDEGVHGGNDACILQSHISDDVRQK